MAKLTLRLTFSALMILLSLQARAEHSSACSDASGAGGMGLSAIADISNTGQVNLQASSRFKMTRDSDKVTFESRFGGGKTTVILDGGKASKIIDSNAFDTTKFDNNGRLVAYLDYKNGHCYVDRVQAEGPNGTKLFASSGMCRDIRSTLNGLAEEGKKCASNFASKLRGVFAKYGGDLEDANKVQKELQVALPSPEYSQASTYLQRCVDSPSLNASVKDDLIWSGSGEATVPAGVRSSNRASQ